MTLNTHNLLHFVSNVRRHGPLKNYWMFIFEHMNGMIKKHVHGPTDSANSIAEMMAITMTLPNQTEENIESDPTVPMIVGQKKRDESLSIDEFDGKEVNRFFRMKYLSKMFHSTEV